MKRSCKELKRIARENLSSQGYRIPMRAFLMATLITALIEFPFSMLQTQILFSMQNIIYLIAQLLIGLISVVFICGQYRIHLSVAKNKQPNMQDLFYPLKHQPDRYILTQCIYFGFTLICFIPAIIGIVLMYFIPAVWVYPVGLILILIGTIFALIFSLNFELVQLIVLEHENYSIKDSFFEIRKLMKGNKGRYFYMQFSFLGMLLLVLLSFGIGILWVEPYITQTTLLFYLDISGQLDKIEIQKKEKTVQTESSVNFYV